MALFSVITFLSLFEFYRLVRGKERIIVNLFDSLGGTLLFIILFSSMGGGLLSSPAKAFAIYFVYLLILFVSRLYIKRIDPIREWAYSALGQIYIALPLGLLNVIAFQPNFMGSQVYTPAILLAFFVFIWANDSGAYLVGVCIGKHKLFPRISPKKSWEGFWGGVVFTLAAAYLFSYFYPNMLTYPEWFGLALVVSVFATWGDLCESVIKRQLDLKDSGGLFPGHGGMLDRFDSTFMAAPAVFIYMSLIF